MTTRLFLGTLALILCLLGTLFTISSDQPSANARPSHIAAVPQWGPDIKVNPTVISTPAAQRNYSIVINPTNPNHLLASYDSYGVHNTVNAYAWSTDAGRSWANDYFQGPWGSQSLSPLGNASLAFDSRGVGYYTSLAVGSDLSGYFVLTTTNGSTWSTPVPIVVTTYDQYRSFPNLAVDRNVSSPYANRLYMFWLYSDNVSPYVHGIEMRYSQDGGRTWSADIAVSDVGNGFSFGPSTAIASDGTVYEASQEIEDNFIENPPNLYLDHSTNGGVTWGADRLITGAPVVPIGRPDFKGRELTLLGSEGCSLLRINHYPSIAVSPGNSNTVYAVWNDGRWGPEVMLCGALGRHGDIAFSRSTDAGLTWTSPVRINDDALDNEVDQFQPTLSIRPDGLLGVMWYDRRYDPAHYMYDLAYSQSTDGGITWSANQRVSDVSSNADTVPDYKGVDDLGYRKSLVFGSDYVLASWLDTRLGAFQGDFFIDRGVFGTATPTPTTPTATPCAMAFTDVHPTDYFYEAVRYLYCRGVISGYGTVFLPYNNTTRGQLSKITVLAEGWTIYAPPQPTFRDVPTTQTFYQYIETAYSHGIISGYSCGVGCLEFRPGANVTRAQLCKIIVLAEGWTPYTPPQPTFRDVPATDPFYRYIEAAYSHSVISGYGCGTGCIEFRPGNLATRGQICKIVYNAINAP